MGLWSWLFGQQGREVRAEARDTTLLALKIAEVTGNVKPGVTETVTGLLVENGQTGIAKVLAAAEVLRHRGHLHGADVDTTMRVLKMPEVQAVIARHVKRLGSAG